MAKKPKVIPSLQEIAGRVGITVPWERITINRWRPDTCGCSIEQWFDDEADPRVVLYANILKTCPEHVDAAPGEALWNTLRGENLRKNTVLGIVMARMDEKARDATIWEFTTARLPGSDERVLTITVPEVSVSDKTSLQDSADLQFGASAVVVN